MRTTSVCARAWYHAPGRSLLGLLLLASCQLAGPSPAAPEPEIEPGPIDPVVEQGPISGSGEAQSAELFLEAETALRLEDPDEAFRLASEIVDRFPTAPVSGRALHLQALAALAAGRNADAEAAAERYIGLLAPSDTRIAEMRLLQAAALVDDAPARVDRLLRLPANASDDQRQAAELLLRETVDGLTSEEMAASLALGYSGAPLAWILEVGGAVAALENGNTEEANRLATSALAGGAAPGDAEIARGVLAGELPGGRPALTVLRIGTVLPLGGAPALADFSRLVAEGVEVAAAEVLGPRFRVEIVARDDEGNPVLSAQMTAELERDRVSGIVGFLEDAALQAAGRARRTGVPVISPTARSADLAGAAAYSLEGPDPQASGLVAQYAATRGYARVAIVHSQAPESSREADAFQAAMDSLGIPVAGRYAYDAGATFFEQQILGARDALRKAEIAALELGEDDTLHVELLEPVGLFLPIPPEDIEFVAPQVIHFGLDTLAIEILGTSAWTDAQVLESVDTRHTTGVVATAPSGVGPGWRGQARFEHAYEEHFQRSLVSPVPAVGYDAALLLLEALRAGNGRRAAFDQLQSVEGATGIFSVIDGRIVREKEVVYVDRATLVPIG